MCDFHIVSNNSAQKLICVQSGEPVSIRLIYGMFCAKLCGLDESKATFEQYRYMGKQDDHSGCDSNDKNDDPRKPTYIKTRFYQR